MATELPQELKDLLTEAETKLEAAKTKDTVDAAAAETLAVATEAKVATAAEALSAHQDANVSATAAIAALRLHFGV